MKTRGTVRKKDAASNIARRWHEHWAVFGRDLPRGKDLERRIRRAIARAEKRAYQNGRAAANSAWLDAASEEVSGLACARIGNAAIKAQNKGTP